MYFIFFYESNKTETENENSKHLIMYLTQRPAHHILSIPFRHSYLCDFPLCKAISSASASTLSRNRECFIQRPRGRILTNDTTSERSVDVETARDGN